MVVEQEKAIRIGSRRFVPDLVVRCTRTNRILLVVEVWHPHAVGGHKKAAFQAAGFRWIEVRSWHFISRHRRRPLPVLDWDGPGLPTGPKQFGLFDLVPPSRDINLATGAYVRTDKRQSYLFNRAANA